MEQILDFCKQNPGKNDTTTKLDFMPTILCFETNRKKKNKIIYSMSLIVIKPKTCTHQYYVSIAMTQEVVGEFHLDDGGDCRQTEYLPNLL